MSEYQYHEWQTIDRVLTPQEQKDVDSLSSHIEVTASRAVVTYQWSDFRHDPKQVLLDYFDAYFYCANWGTLQLMFRFPKGLVDKEAVAPYCDGEIISFESWGNYDVLDLSFYADGYYPGDGWMEAERGFFGFIKLRDDLIDGEYRLLYLAWLCARTTGDKYSYEEEGYVPTNSPELEPPVPAGLNNLSPSLQYFIAVFDVNEHLVQAIAERSQNLSKHPEVNYRKLVSGLSRSECDEFLVELLEGKPGTVAILRKRLTKMSPTREFSAAQDNPCSIQKLEERAMYLEKEEKSRLTEETRQRHIAEMETLAQREEQAWTDVDRLIAKSRKTASVYDKATAQLEKLPQLVEFKQTRPAFQIRIQALAEKYISRNALIGRWRCAGRV